MSGPPNWIEILPQLLPMIMSGPDAACYLSSEGEVIFPARPIIRSMPSIMLRAHAQQHGPLARLHFSRKTDGTREHRCVSRTAVLGAARVAARAHHAPDIAAGALTAIQAEGPASLIWRYVRPHLTSSLSRSGFHGPGGGGR